MTQKRPSPSHFIPLLLILIGFIFLLDNFGYLDFGHLIARYWPVLLILLGLRIIYSRQSSTEREVQIFGVKEKPMDRVRAGEEEDAGDSHTTEKIVENIFGDVRLKFHNKTVNKFKASNIFGNFDLDFSQATLQNQAILQVTGVFGNINICLPADIRLEIKADYIAGSSHIFDDYQSGLFKNISITTPDPGKRNPTVYLKASIIFGDIWIYNLAKS